MHTIDVCHHILETAAGQVHIAASTENLLVVTFGKKNWERIRKNYPDMQYRKNLIITKTERQLQEYFAKKRTSFTLPIAFSGTEFQIKTWQALLTIPYGETRSYSDQAQLIGNPKAVRAVGRSNGLNPIGIIVPCHRVIGKSGKLTGYAGGLEAKEFLLRLEGHWSK